MAQFYLKFLNQDAKVIAQVGLDEFEGPTDDFVEAAELLLAAHYSSQPLLLNQLLQKLQAGDYYVLDNAMKQFVYRPDTVIVNDFDSYEQFISEHSTDYEEQMLPPSVTLDAGLPIEVSPSVQESEKPVQEPLGEDANPVQAVEKPSKTMATKSSSGLVLNVISSEPEEPEEPEKPSEEISNGKKKRRAPRKKGEENLDSLRKQLDEAKKLVETLSLKIQQLELEQNKKRQQFKTLLTEMLDESLFTSDEADLAESLLNLMG